MKELGLKPPPPSRRERPARAGAKRVRGCEIKRVNRIRGCPMSRVFCETWENPDVPKTRNPRPTLTLPQHHRPQRPINPCLIPSPLRLEPGNHIGIQPQRHRLLDRPVHLRHLRRAPQFLGRSPDPGHPPTFRSFCAPLRFHGHTCIVHTIAPVQNVPRGTLLRFCRRPIAAISDVTMPMCRRKRRVLPPCLNSAT